MTRSTNRSGKPIKQRPNKKPSSSALRAIQVRNQAKVQTNALLNLATFSNPNPKTLGPFSDRRRTLIVGDGDFSFSLALATYMGGSNVTATCYDTKQELHAKYPHAHINADALETAGSSVFYGVDATALEKETWIHTVECFDTIAFNFPHLGGATEEDIEKNQKLLRDFFCSTRAVLHDTQGQVLVALRCTPFYDRWDVQAQAKTSGFKLKRIDPFDASLFSGYQPQRTHPAAFRGEPPSTVNSHYYIFVKDPLLAPIDPRVSLKTTPPSKLTGGNKLRKSLQQVKVNLVTSASTSIVCTVCQITFRDQKKYNGHMNSAKHARKVKKQLKT